MKSLHSACATQIVSVTTGVETIASPTTMGKDAGVIAPATTVTTGHGVACAPNRAVLHMTMIVTTDAVDAIKAVDVIKIAGATTIVDVTKAADVTVAGIAAATATPTSWTRTDPGPAQGTGMTALHGGLTRAPINPSSPVGVVTPTQLTSALTAAMTLPTSGTFTA